MSEKNPAALMTNTRQWLEAPERLGEVSKVLPPGMTPDAFMRTVMTTHLRNPKLLETTLESRWLVIMQAAQMGLPLDGRWAAMSKHKDRATFMPMYQGLVQLMYRHARIADVRPPVAVFEGDEWTYKEGLRPTVDHTPARRTTLPKPDEIIAVYASAKIKGGGTPFVWLWREDVERNHRDKSEAYKAGYGPWIDYPISMYLKTAVLQLTKFVPQSAELMQAISRDDDPELEHAPGSPFVPSETPISEILDAIATSGETDPKAFGSTREVDAP